MVRHIRPCITPAIHIAAMYSTMPMVAIQKCSSMALVEYIFFCPNRRGIRKYRQPIEMRPTQPSAPECTWPTVQLKKKNKKITCGGGGGGPAGGRGRGGGGGAGGGRGAGAARGGC